MPQKFYVSFCARVLSADRTPEAILDFLHYCEEGGTVVFADARYERTKEPCGQNST